jgi:hypothetical protein
MAKIVGQVNRYGGIERAKVASARAAAIGTPRKNTIRARIVRATVG